MLLLMSLIQRNFVLKLSEVKCELYKNKSKEFSNTAKAMNDVMLKENPTTVERKHPVSLVNRYNSKAPPIVVLMVLAAIFKYFIENRIRCKPNSNPNMMTYG